MTDTLLLGALRFLALIRHPRIARWHWRYNDRKRLPNPANPQTVHDKWFFRKVFDRSPIFVQVTDKLGVRDWLAKTGIDVATPKVLWTGTRAEDIPDAVLERPVVLKANHSCGTNIFLEAPPTDRAALNARANAFLGDRHGRRELQWAYSGITPRLFVEEFIPNMHMDLKFYCFGDHVQRLVMIYDRFSDTSADVWIPDDCGTLHKSRSAAAVSDTKANRPLPDLVPEARDLASAIGAHFDHIRVDFLSDGQTLWLGELTVYNLGGNFQGIAPSDAEVINALWDLRKSWVLTEPRTGWRGIYARALRRKLS